MKDDGFFTLVVFDLEMTLTVKVIHIEPCCRAYKGECLAKTYEVAPIHGSRIITGNLKVRVW